MRNRILLFSLALILVTSLIIAGCAAPAPAPEPTTLTLVSFLPAGHVCTENAKWFADRVNERAKGELTIDYLGGPEVVPTFDQPEAVRSGVFDINFSCGNYYTGIVPEADASIIAPFEPWVDRETGFYDFMVEVFDEAGIRYLGNHGGGFSTPYYLYTNVRVETPGDLVGQKFRTVPMYIPLLTALGIRPITMPGGEMYLAMERGTIDGFAWPIYAGFVEMGLPEVTKYCIDHPFYRGEMIATVNMDSWNQLSKERQDLLLDVSLELEHWAHEHWAADHERERKEAKEAGVEFIKFSAADGEAFVNLAYEAKWEDLKKMCSSENYARLEQLLKK